VSYLLLLYLLLLLNTERYLISSDKLCVKLIRNPYNPQTATDLPINEREVIDLLMMSR
jgi:hypothetical protein